MDYVGKYVDIDCVNKIVHIKRFGSAQTIYWEIRDVFDTVLFMDEAVPISMLCLHHPPIERNGWKFGNKTILAVGTIYSSFNHTKKLATRLIEGK